MANVYQQLNIISDYQNLSPCHAAPDVYAEFISVRHLPQFLLLVSTAVCPTLSPSPFRKGTKQGGTYNRCDTVALRSVCEEILLTHYSFLANINTPLTTSLSVPSDTEMNSAQGGVWGGAN